MFMIETLWF